MNLVQFIFDRLRAEGVTILFITHDMRLVAEHADRVLVMHEGGLIFDGIPADFFHNTNLMAQAELLPPPIVALTDRLVGEGVAIPSNIATLDEFASAISAAFDVVRRTNA